MRAHWRPMTAPADPPPDAPTTPLIALQRVAKRFDGGLQALHGVSLALRPGEFVSLLGPSGCGKSTVLRLVAGLDEPSAGQVRAPACAPGPDGQTACVFQEPTLMPWARVADNVALPLRLQRRPAAEVDAAVRGVLQRVGLAGFADAWPAQLSGGMKMRVSIARALVTRPRVLLMDEPFAALDDITRQRLNDELLQWWQAQRLTALFVTHSVAEAVFLSQRVLVMAARPGRVVAELAVDQPYPRDPGFRHSPAFAQACARLAAALHDAAGPDPGGANPAAGPQ